MRPTDLEAGLAITTDSERQATGSTSHRLFQGSTWKLVGQTSWRLSRAGTSLAVAWILGPALFGKLGAVHSTVNLFAVYAGFRLGATATKYLAEYRDRAPRRAARVLRLAVNLGALTSFSAALILFLAAPGLAERVFGPADLTRAFRLGAALLFLVVVANVWTHALAGFERFEAQARADLIRAVLLPLICVPAVIAFQVEGMIAGLAAVALVHLVVVRRQTRHAAREVGLPSKLERNEHWRERDVLWRFAFPGLLSGILISSAYWWGRVLLTRSEGGFTELGLYSAADQWRMAVLFVPSILGAVLLPLISRAHGRSEGVSEAVRLGLRAVCTLALPIAVGLTALAGWVELLYGERFRGLAEVVSVVAAAAFLESLSAALNRVFDGMGRRWINLGLHAAWGALFVTAFALLIPRLGALGFALAHLIAALLLVVLQGLFVELALAPRAIRDLAVLLAVAIVLIGSASLAFRFGASNGLTFVGLGLTILASLPAWRRRHALWRLARGSKQ